MRSRTFQTLLILLTLGPLGTSWVSAQPAAQKKTDLPGREVSSLGNEHIDRPTDPHIPYNSAPPTSGPHLHNIARWGIHKQPIPNELQVHNLEDGGVMIQYNCKNCNDLIARLEKFAAKYNKVVVAPYPFMKSAIALTAWGRIDTMDQIDEARIERFIQAYMGIDHHPKSE